MEVPCTEEVCCWIQDAGNEKQKKAITTMPCMWIPRATWLRCCWRQETGHGCASARELSVSKLLRLLIILTIYAACWAGWSRLARFVKLSKGRSCLVLRWETIRYIQGLLGKGRQWQTLQGCHKSSTTWHHVPPPLILPSRMTKGKSHILFQSSL